MIDLIITEIDELKARAAKIKAESADIQSAIRVKKAQIKVLREDKRRGRMSKRLKAGLEALEASD